MNTSFYPQDHINMFSSPPHQADQYNNGYFTSLHHIESSLLNFSALNDNNTPMKMEANFYPSPSTSPLPSEMMLLTPDSTTDLQYQFYPPQQQQQQQFLDTMMMVPPLGQEYESYDISAVDAFTSMLTSTITPEFYEHKAPAIELVDRFIAQHQAALEENILAKEQKQQKQQPCKETSWSYWTYSSSRDSTPEIVSDVPTAAAVNSNELAPAIVVPEVVNKKNKKTNKVIKGTTIINPDGATTIRRRGRGKGVKNSVANKKAIAAAAAAASSTGVMSTSTSSSKVPLDGALYVCQHPDCGRSFTRPYNLTSHLKVT